MYQFWSQLNSTLWGMCSRLVHLRIRKCKHFLNWLVFVKKEPKLFPTDKTLNKYEVLSVVLYKNYEYKNRTMNNAFLITYNNCRTPQLLFEDLKKILRGFIGVQCIIGHTPPPFILKKTLRFPDFIRLHLEFFDKIIQFMIFFFIILLFCANLGIR